MVHAFSFFLFLSTRKCMKIVILSLEKSDMSYLEVPVFRYIEFSSCTSRDKIHGCTDNKPKLKKKGTSCWNCCQVKKAFFTIDTNIHIINICFMYNTCLQIYTVALLKCIIFYLFINTSYDIKFFVKKTFYTAIFFNTIRVGCLQLHWERGGRESSLVAFF